MPKELTREQQERQDFVDNACQNLLNQLAGVAIPWNIELIGEIRDAAQSVIVDNLQMMTEQKFYPFTADEKGAVENEPDLSSVED